LNSDFSLKPPSNHCSMLCLLRKIFFFSTGV
jgi:hypothetical protein